MTCGDSLFSNRYESILLTNYTVETEVSIWLQRSPLCCYSELSNAANIFYTTHTLILSENE
jgi:hypothetical protein